MQQIQAKSVLQEVLRKYKSVETHIECSEEALKTYLSMYQLKVVSKDFSGQLYEYESQTMKDMGAEINMHNVHHFILASPSRRNMSDFGLGGPIDNDYKLARTCSYREAVDEEELTNALDFLRAVQHGYVLKLLDPYINEEHILTLFNMGIITEAGNIKDHILNLQEDEYAKTN